MTEQEQEQVQIQEQSVARFASQWDSYLKYYTSWLAPMGVEILFLLYFDFAQFDKAKKDCSEQRD